MRLRRILVAKTLKNSNHIAFIFILSTINIIIFLLYIYIIFNFLSFQKFIATCACGSHASKLPAPKRGKMKTLTIFTIYHKT